MTRSTLAPASELRRACHRFVPLASATILLAGCGSRGTTQHQSPEQPAPAATSAANGQWSPPLHLHPAEPDR